MLTYNYNVSPDVRDAIDVDCMSVFDNCVDDWLALDYGFHSCSRQFNDEIQVNSLFLFHSNILYFQPTGLVDPLIAQMSIHSLCIVCCERYYGRLDFYCLSTDDLAFDSTFGFLDSFCDPV